MAKKVDNRKSGKLQARRNQKQTEAIQRQTEYNALTTSEKLSLLDKRLGEGVGAKKKGKSWQSWFSITTKALIKSLSQKEPPSWLLISAM